LSCSRILFASVAHLSQKVRHSILQNELQMESFPHGPEMAHNTDSRPDDLIKVIHREVGSVPTANESKIKGMTRYKFILVIKRTAAFYMVTVSDAKQSSMWSKTWFGNSQRRTSDSHIFRL
jgi:hypothetical protein